MLYETNLRELYQKLSETGRFKVLSKNGLHALSSPVSHPALNTAFGTINEPLLDQLNAFFRDDAYCFLIDADNDTTENLLINNNFTPQLALPEMRLDLTNYPQQPISQNITVLPVETLKQFEQWCLIEATVLEVSLAIITNYNKPVFEYCTLLNKNDINLYLAYFDNVPAGTGMVHIGSKTLGISSVSVKPEFRRRGIATAITVACLATPRPETVNTAVLIAFAAARILYEKSGFIISRYIRALSRR